MSVTSEYSRRSARPRTGSGGPDPLKVEGQDVLVPIIRHEPCRPGVVKVHRDGMRWSAREAARQGI